ncbi:MAG: DUF1302 domain-containing protein [Deferrisomatales bacterium]|nr:DUF1302 domain-containing protein [Deferrisomatales bacterium]
MRQLSKFSKACFRGLGALALLAVLSAPPAQAFQFDTGNSDVKISWDNTAKYSVALRVEGQSDKLTEASKNSSNVNQDDGDRNFDQGLISNRFDLLSEFDASYKNFGLRVSGAAWYDFVYNTSNDNDSAATANAHSVDHDEFTDDTRDLHGRDAELLDAFVYGLVDAGPTTTSFRVGQYAMQWGESLFFGGNGIAGGMAPVDVVKLLSVPNSQFKEIIRPVPQASVQFQMGSRVTLGAYYQFAWEKTVLPGVGSYFSSNDTVDEGGERLLLEDHPILVPNPGFDPTDPTSPPFIPGGAASEAWFRGDDLEARDDGQGGLQLRVRPGLGLDLGFYAIRYHEKVPQLYARLYKLPGVPVGVPVIPGPGAPDINAAYPAGVDPISGKAGEYYLVYPEDVEAYGFSASTTFGDWNLATELSIRRNTPLVSSLQSDFYFGPGTPEPDNDSDPAYAVGKSVHANFSWFATFGPTFISNESAFLGEVAWNRRTSITDNEDALDPNTDKDAWGFRMVYEPTYRQVLSGLDLSVPLGFAYFPKGKSSVVGTFGPDKGGDMSLGLNASYLDVWRFSLSYTHFYGPEEGFLTEPISDTVVPQSMKQSLADRDFVAFSVRRTF